MTAVILMLGGTLLLLVAPVLLRVLLVAPLRVLRVAPLRVAPLRVLRVAPLLLWFARSMARRHKSLATGLRWHGRIIRRSKRPLRRLVCLCQACLRLLSPRALPAQRECVLIGT